MDLNGPLSRNQNSTNQTPLEGKRIISGLGEEGTRESK
jgi:hypothetical protein